MSLHADFEKLKLVFKKPAGTSRGVLHEKESWIIRLHDKITGRFGIGECPYLPGLSVDNYSGIEGKIEFLCSEINAGNPIDMDSLIDEWPAVRFGFECAAIGLKSDEPGILFDTPFSRSLWGIPINGLVWMGSIDDMAKQVSEKINQGFTCLKFKIGSWNFDDELNLIREVRKNLKFSGTIRLDANGAFTPENSIARLRRLADFDIHSIEQPIKQGQWNNMAEICRDSPIPVALDEELIGNSGQMETLLDTIRPDYLIVKPSLLGGLTIADNWIQEAEKRDIDWWATSALESNIGLNAIAQWVSSKNIKLEQGLGTGALFIENTRPELKVKEGGTLWLIAS